jgi:Na+-transporting methylmalonyl-CoA/oxaloacetate decarboxylase gamma subunit
MRKWILLLFALALVVNLVAMGIGCKAKTPEKPVVKEEVKPPEAKPAEAPPAEKPAEKPAEPVKK